MDRRRTDFDSHLWREGAHGSLEGLESGVLIGEYAEYARFYT